MSNLQLPGLIELHEYGGDWDQYLEAIHRQFKRDFVNSTTFFKGRRVGLKKHPEFKGKEYAFWHCITEGPVEEERNANLRRCERIAWISFLINNATHPSLKLWRNERNGDERILIFHEDESYLVVLTDRIDYILLWTAYPVERKHRRRKLLKEHDKYHENLKNG